MEASNGVTLVVVPRERFSVALRSLESLFAHTADHPFDLVYVDGNSPPRIRDRLREESERRGFKLIRTEHYLSPNRARNLGLEAASTPYVVFVDNDVLLTPGWLGPLVDCAEQTGAWVAGPLILEGEYEDGIIHNAGGFYRFEGPVGHRMLAQDNRFGHQSREEMPTELQRHKVGYVEFHCALVRRAMFDVIGPLDEQLLSTREHLDLCLRAAEAGGEVWSEPGSSVVFNNPPPVTREDLPFFLLRWSERWNEASLRHFASKYGLASEYVERAARSNRRRQVIFDPVRDRTRRAFGPQAARVVGKALTVAERTTNRLIIGRLARSVEAASRR